MCPRSALQYIYRLSYFMALLVRSFDVFLSANFRMKECCLFCVCILKIIKEYCTGVDSLVPKSGDGTYAFLVGLPDHPAFALFLVGPLRTRGRQSGVTSHCSMRLWMFFNPWRLCLGWSPHQEYQPAHTKRHQWDCNI